MDKLIFIVLLSALINGVLSDNVEVPRVKKDYGPISVSTGSPVAADGIAITPAPENILSIQSSPAVNPIFSGLSGGYRQAHSYAQGYSGYKKAAAYSLGGEDDGSYKPHIHGGGDYVHDGAGGYLHQDAKYVHDAKPYIHEYNPYLHDNKPYVHDFRPYAHSGLYGQSGKYLESNKYSGYLSGNKYHQGLYGGYYGLGQYAHEYTPYAHSGLYSQSGKYQNLYGNHQNLGYLSGNKYHQGLYGGYYGLGQYAQDYTPYAHNGLYSNSGKYANYFGNNQNLGYSSGSKYHQNLLGGYSGLGQYAQYGYNHPGYYDATKYNTYQNNSAYVKTNENSGLYSGIHYPYQTSYYSGYYPGSSVYSSVSNRNGLLSSTGESQGFSSLYQPATSQIVTGELSGQQGSSVLDQKVKSGLTSSSFYSSQSGGIASQNALKSSGISSGQYVHPSSQRFGGYRTGYYQPGAYASYHGYTSPSYSAYNGGSFSAKSQLGSAGAVHSAYSLPLAPVSKIQSYNYPGYANYQSTYQNSGSYAPYTYGGLGSYNYNTYASSYPGYSPVSKIQSYNYPGYANYQSTFQNYGSYAPYSYGGLNAYKQYDYSKYAGAYPGYSQYSYPSTAHSLASKTSSFSQSSSVKSPLTPVAPIAPVVPVTPLVHPTPTPLVSAVQPSLDGKYQSSYSSYSHLNPGYYQPGSYNAVYNYGSYSPYTYGGLNAYKQYDYSKYAGSYPGYSHYSYPSTAHSLASKTSSFSQGSLVKSPLTPVAPIAPVAPVVPVATVTPLVHPTPTPLISTVEPSLDGKYQSSYSTYSNLYPGYYQPGSYKGLYNTGSYNAYRYPSVNTKYHQSAGVFGQNGQYVSGVYPGSTLVSSTLGSADALSGASGISFENKISSVGSSSSFGKKVAPTLKPIHVAPIVSTYPAETSYGHLQSGYLHGYYQQPQYNGLYGRYAHNYYQGYAPQCSTPHHLGYHGLNTFAAKSALPGYSYASISPELTFQSQPIVHNVVEADPLAVGYSTTLAPIVPIEVKK